MTTDPTTQGGAARLTDDEREALETANLADEGRGQPPALSLPARPEHGRKGSSSVKGTRSSRPDDNPDVERVCDHPGLDHSRWSYCWPCPKCGVCKFIGHGPLPRDPRNRHLPHRTRGLT